MKKVIAYALAMVLSVGSLTLTSCGDDEPENGDNTENTENTENTNKTDALTNTKWRGSVDGISVIIEFKANSKASETANGETATGSYSVKGNELLWNVNNSVLRNSYGPTYTFTKTSSSLVLKNDLGETVRLSSY